jgi:hypothetical protein
MSGAGTSRPSVVVFCAALAAVGAGAAVGLAAVPRVGTFLGMLLGGFLVGVGISPRPLAESAIAAAVVTLGIVATAGVPGTGITGAMAALGSVAPETLLPSLALSAAAGGFGAHLGDDLRDGLSEPLDDSSDTGSGSASPPNRTRRAPTDSTAGDNATPATTDVDREMVPESADES